MPDGYYDSSSELYGDVFARYKFAGIELKYQRGLIEEFRK